MLKTIAFFSSVCYNVNTKRKGVEKMKKLSKLCALALLVVMAISLVACGTTYPAIKTAFENAGYEQSDTLEGLYKDYLKYTDKEGKDVALQAHAFKKTGEGTALILEFKATDDMIQYYKDNKLVRDAVKDVTENDDAKAFYNMLVEKGYANGNCMLVPILPVNVTKMTEIMKNAK